MKTLGRTLIILAVLALAMGIAYMIVHSHSSSTPPGFAPGNERFSRLNGAPPAFPEGERPEFPGEGREYRDGRGGGGWVFGAIKNIAIIGIIVALIVVPKSWIQKRKKTAQIAIG
jgi:hypothetical protein